MKCPHCGEELQAGKSCEKCGREPAARREVEVRYTDFKVTELLDIKMPGQGPSEKEAEKPGVEGAKPGKTQRQERQSGNKGSRLAVVALLILLAAACGYYLLKLLINF